MNKADNSIRLANISLACLGLTLLATVLFFSVDPYGPILEPAILLILLSIAAAFLASALSLLIKQHTRAWIAFVASLTLGIIAGIVINALRGMCVIC